MNNHSFLLHLDAFKAFKSFGFFKVLLIYILFYEFVIGILVYKHTFLGG